MKNCPLKILEKKQSITGFPSSRPRGKLLTTEEKYLINKVYYELLAETAVESVSTKSALLRACRYTGISKNTIYDIRREWQSSQEFTTTKTRRGRNDQNLHWSRHWISDIQKIIVDLNYNGEPVTVRKILKEINSERYLGDYGLVLSRSTCFRLLHLLGFSYKKVSKTTNFEESREIQDWRQNYLRHRQKVKDSNLDVIELWLDESYCNQYYVGGQSWFRPGDFVRRGKRGRRWVIVHCGGSEGWVGRPLVFEASSKTADYHDNMNAEKFEEYFKELCEEILKKYPQERIQQGVYIYMDNAAYHKRVEGLPKGISKLKKQELIMWMKKCDPQLTDENTFNGKSKEEIYSICRQDLQKFRGTSVAEGIAKSYNFQVHWLPPYHPILNPIEEAWGITKGYVADVNNGKDFQKVKEYIILGFEKVTPEVWKSLVRRTYKNEEDLVIKHNIVTEKEVTDNPLIINLDDDSDDDLDLELEELTLEDIVGDEDITGELVHEFDHLNL